MLKGSLKNIEELSKYGDNFKTAVKFLQTLDFDTLLPQ